MTTFEKFLHIPVGTVTAGGTTSSDTAWTVTATTAFPVAAAGSTQFHVCDPAATGELILVTTAPGGTGAGQSWTVTRGADGTTAVAHTAGFTIYQVTPASWLEAPTHAGLVTTSGLASTVKSVTAAYTATANDFFIEGDASVSGTFVVTLPTSSVQTGQIYVIKKVDGGSNEIDVTPATGTIDGRATIPLRFFNSQTIAQWDGTTWKVIGGYFATGGIDSISVSFFEQGIAVGLLRSETANYTTQPNDFEIACNATGGAFTVTLGSTAQFAQLLAVKKTDSSAHAVTVAAGSGLIDGAASVSLTAQNQAVFVQWDGTNWQILGSNGFGGLSGVTVSGTAANTDIIAATGSTTAVWTNKLTVNTSTSAVATTNNTLDGGAGTASFAGVVAHTAGTDTSGTATYSSPSFTSGTAAQLNTTQDAMLYVVNSAGTTQALTIAIGPTSGVADSIVPSITAPVGGAYTIRIPKAWWVKITATIANFQISAVTC